MPRSHPLVDIALELARASDALAGALEAGDLDTAEGLVAERDRLLAMAAGLPGPGDDGDRGALTAARAAIAQADRRSERAVRAALEGLQAEMAALARGARAVHAYLGTDPMAPGWIDRRD
jgi:hypothetical protein